MRLMRPAFVVVFVALTSCSDDGNDAPRSTEESSAVIVTTSTSATPPIPTSTPPATATATTDDVTVPPPTTSPPTTAAPSTATTAPPEEPDPQIAFEEMAVLERPAGIAWRAGDPTLFVVEQPGRVTAIDPATNATRTVLDITDRTVIGGNEQGLLGLAFASAADRAYVNYTDLDGDTVIAGYAVAADGVIDPASEQVLIQVDQPYRNHNGGEIEFGPDGMLYIGLGDGGSANDPERRAMDPSTPLGKLLRISPAADAPLGYVIPPDNPYVGVDGAGPEVFAIGLRNPWKFTWDPLTGDLWIADVGQNQMEEIDHVPAPADGSPPGRGLNFGWSAFEGTTPTNSDVDGSEAVAPVLTYEHGPDGCSVSGGAVYRGAAIAGLDGDYVYGDHCSGRVWALDREAAENLLLATIDGGGITAIEAGPDGELYMTDLNGPVRRIVSG
jgi:glucose/arabinose dehydrogenase